MATSIGSAAILLSVDAQGVTQGLDRASGEMNDWRNKWAGVSNKLPPLKPEIIPDTSRLESEAKKADEKVRGFFTRPISLNIATGGFLDKAASISIGANLGRSLAGIATAGIEAARGTKGAWDTVANVLTRLPVGIGASVEAFGQLYASILNVNGKTAELSKEKERLANAASIARDRLERETKAMQQQEQVARQLRDAGFGSEERRISMLEMTSSNPAQSQFIDREKERLELAKVQAEQDDISRKVLTGDLTKKQGNDLIAAKEQEKAQIYETHAMRREKMAKDEYNQTRWRNAQELSSFIQTKNKEQQAAQEANRRRRDSVLEADSKIRQMYLQSIGERNQAEKEAINERYRQQIEAAKDPTLKAKLDLQRKLELGTVGRDNMKAGYRASEVQVSNFAAEFRVKSSDAFASNKMEGLTIREIAILEKILYSINNGVTGRAA